MNNVMIRLSSIQDVRTFVDIVTKYNIDIDLSSGRYVVDAKSIMGIFSLDLLNPIKLSAQTDNEDEIWEKVMASTKLTGMYLVDKDGKMEKGHGDSVKTSTRATKNIMACTWEELAEVVETSKKRVVEHTNAIENGKISINPVTYSRRDPCEYCKSSAICGYRKQYGGTDDE